MIVIQRYIQNEKTTRSVIQGRYQPCERLCWSPKQYFSGVPSVPDILDAKIVNEK